MTTGLALPASLASLASPTSLAPGTSSKATDLTETSKVTPEVTELPFNYIDKAQHLGVSLIVCKKCLISIQDQLRESTKITLHLHVCLPAWYISCLTDCTTLSFEGRCSCISSKVSCIFQSFKGRIYDMAPTYIGDTQANITFHITNSVRKTLPLLNWIMTT